MQTIRIRSYSNQSQIKNRSIKRDRDDIDLKKTKRMRKENHARSDHIKGMDKFIHFVNQRNENSEYEKSYILSISKEAQNTKWEVCFYFDQELIFKTKVTELEAQTIQAFTNSDGSIKDFADEASIRKFLVVKKNAAQRLIQRRLVKYYKSHEAEIKQKNIYISVMEEINRIILECGSANMVNKNVDTSEPITFHIVNEIRKIENPIRKYQTVIDEGVGNCFELALLLYILLKYSYLVPAKMIATYEFADDDHVIVIIGDPQDKNSIVLDPWIKYLDLPKSSHWRPNPSSSEERIRGFCGTIEEYTKFLQMHPTCFVQERSYYEFKKQVGSAPLFKEFIEAQIYNYIMEKPDLCEY